MTFESRQIQLRLSLLGLVKVLWKLWVFCLDWVEMQSSALKLDEAQLLLPWYLLEREMDVVWKHCEKYWK